MKLIYMTIGLLLAFSANANLIEVTGNRTQQDQSYQSINFGTVWVNTRAVQYYRLKNTGATPLTFKEAYIYGGDFSADHSCTKGLLPNEICNFSVAYWPMFEGMSSGRFVLSFNEEDIVFDLWGQANRM